MRLTLLLVGLLLALLAGTFVVTGVSLIPPSVALGPCLKDYTSPVSYRPRQSPLATLRFRLADAGVELCYGRPTRRDRVVFGGLVPWDSLWRLGANEPTRLYLDKPITLGGIPLAPGRYSLYTIPRPEAWTIFVSRSVRHWGNDISAAVREREVGRVLLPVEHLAAPVDTLTARVTGDLEGGRAELSFSWEETRVTLELDRVAVPSNLGAVP
jgi:Protein of unknown function (DUF2911)